MPEAYQSLGMVGLRSQSLPESFDKWRSSTSLYAQAPINSYRTRSTLRDTALSHATLFHNPNSCSPPDSEALQHKSLNLRQGVHLRLHLLVLHSFKIPHEYWLLMARRLSLSAPASASRAATNEVAVPVTCPVLLLHDVETRL